MRTSETTRLLRVVREVSLTVFVGVITDNLNRVLVSTYRTVSTQTVEFSFEHTFTAQSDFFFLRKRSESYVVYDTDSEVVLRHRHSQVFEYRDNLSRSSVLRTQTVATANDNRSIFCTVEAVFNVKIQRFTVSTRFFSTVKNCDSLSSLRYSSQEVFSRERTIQVYGNHTHFFTVGCQVVDCFTGCFRYRTHCDNHAFCIFCSVVIEQTVFATCNLGNFIHVFFYDSRNSFIVVVA